ncbi:hypothetical protein [Flavobacterium sp.]|uniref:hypothetical protein n=1 Tax=Flavobacterium sp. TaxID=239 RepID=UPI00391B8FB8
MPKITCFLFLLFSIVGFSQSEKQIHGKVLFGQTPLTTIDVVNLNSREITTTDMNGHFSISAKVKDTLFIISKAYADRRIALTQELLNQNNLIIYLEKKPIELDDVEITTTQSVKIKISQADIDAIKIAKDANKLKVLNVNDGTIENGIDFVRMGKGLLNLFKNKDKEKPEKPLPPIPFKDYLALNFDPIFYTEKLKLKPEEIDLFIAFCETDPKAKTISERQDVLETLGFLLDKNEEFNKLER